MQAIDLKNPGCLYYGQDKTGDRTRQDNAKTRQYKKQQGSGLRLGLGCVRVRKGIADNNEDTDTRQTKIKTKTKTNKQETG